jgi:hypothetical protein
MRKETEKQKKQHEEDFVKLLSATGRLLVSTSIWEALDAALMAAYKKRGVEIIHAPYLEPGTVLAAKPLKLPFDLGTITWE